MQIKKAELQNKILEVAKTEFLEKGYDKTSFRGIAEVLQISHSNIMTYFKNKADLFDKLVEPAILFMQTSLTEPIGDDAISDEALLSYLNYESAKARNIKLFKSIAEYREPLTLLLFKANTYDYKDIRKHSELLFCETIDAYIAKLSERDLIDEPKISVAFKRTLASLFISSVEKITRYEMTEREIEQYAIEMTMLLSYGSAMIIGRKQ